MIHHLIGVFEPKKMQDIADGMGSLQDIVKSTGFVEVMTQGLVVA